MDHTRNINTIRLLAVDMVEAANSGHPGLPLGAAPMAYALWTRHLRFNPHNPRWPGRDRFVLSAGHGSALLYAMLHLFDYPEMTIEELKRFRQIDGITPGHPESWVTPGVEVTTGPLGQGLANAVGIALAERHLAAALNRDGFPVIDFHTYVIASDGDLMEGVTSEACSLAGHLKLNRLIVLYDDNNISIDGSTDLSFTEDVSARYRSYGWNVDEVEDGNDIEAIDAAITRCRAIDDRPSLIHVRTIIGYGAPNKANSADVHGSALGAEELARTREFFGFDPNESFTVADDVRSFFNEFTESGAAKEKEHTEMLERYRKEHFDLAKQLDTWIDGSFHSDLASLFPRYTVGDDMATRAASGKVLDAIAPQLPLLIGGSADLTPSNNTKFKGSIDLTPDNYGGRYIRYGVREHGMGSIMNGMAATGLRPYAGTFLTFSDYMRPAIRMAALSQYPTIFVFTHDSIGLGEDGPTHQPVEHYAALRAIPNLMFIRPADANETAFAWQLALENTKGPTAMALTRQKVPTLPGTENGGALRGGYVVSDSEEPIIILAATGSEVSLAVEAQKLLAAREISARVVSLPCWSLFDEQDPEYREEVMPGGIPVLGIEAGVQLGWDRYAFSFLGMTGYGLSGKDVDVMKHFGFTPEHVADEAAALLDDIGSIGEAISDFFEENGTPE